MLPFSPTSLPQLFFFFFTNAFVILVCAFCALLFWVVHRRERKLRTAWRAAGFFTLALAASMSLLSPLLPRLIVVGALLEALGFFLVYQGVKKELTLSHLRTISPYGEMTNDRGFGIWALGLWSLNGHWGLVIGHSLLHLLSIAFIAATLLLQLRRFFAERDGRLTFMQNLYPLVGYVCLLVSTLLAATSPLLAEYIWLPHAMLILTVLGFFFLSLWAWIFIRVRPSLRISWLLLANGTLAVTFVAVTLTSLIVLGLRTLLAEI